MTIDVHLSTIGGNLPKLWKQKVLEVHTSIAADLAEEAAEIVSILEVYPPVPPGSTYMRTYNLQGSWRIIPRSLGGSVSINIRNDAVEIPSGVINRKTGKVYMRRKVKGRYYAGFVQGPVGGSTTGKTQWWVHRSHDWLSIDDVLLGRQTARRLAEKMRRRLRITV